MSERRVVVTGLGATTPLGGTIAETWKAFSRGGRGPSPPRGVGGALRAAGALRVHPGPEAGRGAHQVEIRRMDPSAQYAVIAARAAMEDAGSPEIDPLRLGVAIGTGIGGVWTLLDQWDILREKGVRPVFPLSVPMLMPNTSAGNVSLQLGARAGATRPSRRVPPGRSMGTGFDMIRGGRADIVVAGGTEAAIHPLPFAGFAQMQALSTRNDDIDAASRPYDTGRDGFVMAEGPVSWSSRSTSTPRRVAPGSTPSSPRSGCRRTPPHPPRARGGRCVARHARGRGAGRAQQRRHRPHQRPRDVHSRR